MTPPAQDDQLAEALEKTNRRLQRVVKTVTERGGAAVEAEEVQKELKRARRQIRENKEVLAARSS
jgi:hypothetical protein